ncbi:DUF2752 domain-containing protein [Paradesertivirga mongoliensis]|uniref:DUF2752 domain-containing protein n=1 Tax=Paradesertivirga mongoliensis TaxID=2100740 RepID=A0ABW4ZJ78_9SPHI|nr:DUF2752 domain-containing protein [Pedobacter mongoliensis]
MNISKHFELVFWIAALTALACSTPSAHHHFSLCPLSNLGVSWCPGCGLGRSISCIFHGDLSQSFSYHWFGIPTLAILLHRIFILSKKYLVYF